MCILNMVLSFFCRAFFAQLGEKMPYEEREIRRLRKSFIFRTYAVAQKLSFAAVLHLLFVFRFCALRAQKRNTDKTESTMLPQAKRRLRAVLRKSCQIRTCSDFGSLESG